MTSSKPAVAPTEDQQALLLLAIKDHCLYSRIMRILSCDLTVMWLYR